MSASQPRIVLLHLGQIHDETPALRDFLADRGMASDLVPLPSAEALGEPRRDAIDWARFDRVSLRDCRGSHGHADFLPRITELARRLAALAVPLANPLPVIQAGHAKSAYLPRLERQGIPLIPTRWLPRGWRGSLVAMLESCGWSEAVLKPSIGSRSWQTYRVRREGRRLVIHGADGAVPVEADGADALAERLAREGEVCLQRFLPAIGRAGEFSAVFLGGRFSHAVAKTVAYGGWIAHEHFGGCNRPHRASEAERGWAEAVERQLRRRFGVLPYARIDGIRDEGGDLLLLECELVAPRLFLTEGEAFGRYADVLLGAMGRG
ncbi:RimK family alpha-L-glutamate ligase [Synechococcus sp. CCY 9618]|uniref:ATP-grasp domain-containing protein n=1 Tax=Synechococcus sp. CCY 9618 TaxID=2815602 RepID=UPI001C230080|nr:hypothetical protein [Synechococcus sp. CCY 9618]